VELEVAREEETAWSGAYDRYWGGDGLIVVGELVRKMWKMLVSTKKM
jgi:hypothetical protein